MIMAIFREKPRRNLRDANAKKASTIIEIQFVK